MVEIVPWDNHHNHKAGSKRKAPLCGESAERQLRAYTCHTKDGTRHTSYNNASLLEYKPRDTTPDAGG